MTIATKTVDGHSHGNDHHGHDHRDPSDTAAGPAKPDTLISARGLNLRRGVRPILEGVDLDIGPGEIVTVIGPNGAGKTTLVRILLG